MFLEEYNEDEVHQVFHDDGYDEGAFDQLVKLVNKNLLSLDIAANEAGMSMEEFAEVMSKKQTKFQQHKMRRAPCGCKTSVREQEQVGS